MLHNRTNSKELKDRLRSSDERRVTISFYKYHKIAEPATFRNELYRQLDNLGVMGRIYVAHEGINAQISVPEIKLGEFKSSLFQIDFLNNVRLNIAVEDNGKSFFKLKILVRKKIVAD